MPNTISNSLKIFNNFTPLTDYNIPSLDSFIFTIKNNEATISLKPGTSLSGNIILPDTAPDGTPITSIDTSLFYDNKSISNVVFPSSYTSIPSQAFENSSIKSVDLSQTQITEIPTHAFSNTKSLTSISLPECLDRVKGYAFFGSALPSITFPESLQTLDERALWLVNLKSLYIPKNVATIGKLVISGHSLQQIIVDEENTSYFDIDNVALASYSGDLITMASKCGLRSFTIPDNITTLKENSLYPVSTLNNINIGSSLATIEKQSLPSLKTLSINSNNPNLMADDRAIFSADGKTMIIYFYSGSTTYYTVPDGVTKIDQYCFYGIKGLQSVTLPDGLTEIGTQAFSKCTSLSSINIPNSVTTYGNGVFQQTKITSFVVSSNITTISYQILSSATNLTNVEFYNKLIPVEACIKCSNLKTVIIGENVKQIGVIAFKDCKALESVEFQGTTPPTLGNANVFSNTNSTFKIYVPDSAVSAYKSATFYSQYASQIYPISSKA